ncbi:hypothetical protein RBG61_11950 [Paludicola sp. MB14-C6]|uniref:hypothetical protein n=1 Tax=Paludihabitans sp. MB14-C6 TaxID=3070656 RepID=UPI0027DEA663|nr:hypothetical protein [Paludicola sp. MB14-C6]WMJ22696.1 hypothetical protein RBG61_11950 [Paludicola sp. MB14-C6]
MIVVILALIFLILLGLYYILSAILKLPLHSKRKKVNLKESLELLIDKATQKVTPYIKLNEQKKNRIQRALEVTNNKTTAEFFQAKAYIKFTVVFLIGLLSLCISWFVTLITTILAILVYLNDFHSLYKSYHKCKKEFENEIPAFTSYIKEKLNSQRNIINLLDEYTLTDNIMFAKELEITVASMRTSSPENALLQLNRRISSEKLNMVIQGLLGIARGEDQQFYFQMISYDFDIIDKNNLRKEVLNIPKKLRMYMFLLFTAIVVEFLTPVLIDIYTYAREFFK